MSNRRSIMYLLALLLSAVAANLWLDLSGPDPSEVVRRRSLVSGADMAVEMEISSPDGQSVRFAKTDRWRIVAPFRAAAEPTAVNRLTDALAFGPIIDSWGEADVAKLGHSVADFGLERPVRTLRVVTPLSETTVKFGFRSPLEKGVYASVEGSPNIYIVPNETFDAVDISTDAWRRRTVFRIRPDEVSDISIRRGGSSFRLVRSGERWEVVEPSLGIASAAAVKRIIDTVLACKVRKFVWPVGATNEAVTASVATLSSYGLDPEICETVVFRGGDGRDHSISFGSAADADTVYALVHGGMAVATVSADAKDSVAVDANALKDGRLFPFEKSAVQRISIADGDTSYLLSRGDNATWRLESPVAAAADEDAVSALIDKLLVMRNGDHDEHGVKVSLSTNSVPVSVSKDALLGDAGFEQLRSKVILDIDSVTVRRLVITQSSSDKPVAVIFDPDRKGWNVESSGRSGVIDTDRLGEVLSALSPLKAKSVARLKVAQGELARYGLENPSCIIAVDRLLEDSVRRNILIGNEAGFDGDAYATVGSSEAVFVLDGKTVRTLTSGVFAE